MSSEGRRPRLTEYGCTNEGCYNMGGWEFVDVEEVAEKCPRCGGPMEPMHDWLPASEVERLREALGRIANSFGVLPEEKRDLATVLREYAWAALHPDEKEEPQTIEGLALPPEGYVELDEKEDR